MTKKSRREYAPDKLRHQLVSQLFHVGRHLEVFERNDLAIRCYNQCLAIDARAEEVCRQLMALYQRIGRPADVSQGYRQCNDTLSRQLGVSPSPQTQALLKELTQPTKFVS